MADFSAPSTPPPPKVPEGWIARWNEQYKEWFYVNTYTKKSQWDKPTDPAQPPRPGNDNDMSQGPPPSYDANDSKRPGPTDTKHNPYTTAAHNDEDEDTKLARKLQAEEDAKARQARGSGGSASPFPSQLPPRAEDQDAANRNRGLLGKLFGGGRKPSQPGYPGAGYAPQQGYAPPQQAYGQPPYGQPTYGQPMYGGYPPQAGYGGGYPQQGPPQGAYYGGAAPQRRPGGGGMGAAGGAALGLGAGLIGGALLGSALEHHDDQIYDQGYQNGQDNDYGGDDYGGGDDFGGDF